MRLVLSLTAAATVIPLSGAMAVDAKNVSAVAFGINCEGSMKCNGQPHDTAELLVGYITDGINPGRYYSNGQHIACRNNICAFLQGVPEPMSGAGIKIVAKLIVGHGCTVCGSVPTGPDNDDRYGELTFNFVSEAACGDGGMC
ncbi:KP4 killer toxin [Mycena venus]|uniref:KP4 killer toxin n=1 Tax=Mycena venus TaxID=2733690 RepID=A0A8H6XVR1_9AGAR|nr:KP4 killer toxin [Mycena venus]